MFQFLIICGGGAVGTGLRFLLQGAALRVGLAQVVPLGTLAINLVGSFAIALVLRREGWDPLVRDALAIGVLGGFTTYSSFNEETLRLWERGAVGMAVVYVAVTVVGGLVAGVIARQVAG